MNSLHYLGYLVGLSPPLTQTTADEREALCRLAAGKRRLAEVGVFHGVNTRALRQAMANDGVIIAIDPFQRSFFGLRGYGWARRIAHREVARVVNGRVLWVEDTGASAPSRADVAAYLPVDFIFIDGDHSWEGVEGDWNAWSPQIAPGGVVALHDSRNRDGAGSERFTNEVILKDARFELVATVDSLTVLRRR